MAKRRNSAAQDQPEPAAELAEKLDLSKDESDAGEDGSEEEEDSPVVTSEEEFSDDEEASDDDSEEDDDESEEEQDSDDEELDRAIVDVIAGARADAARQNDAAAANGCALPLPQLATYPVQSAFSRSCLRTACLNTGMETARQPAVLMRRNMRTLPPIPPRTRGNPRTQVRAEP